VPAGIKNVRYFSVLALLAPSLHEAMPTRFTLFPGNNTGFSEVVPQEQRVIPLVLFRRAPGQGVSTGDHAAWICVCRRGQPLIGRLGPAQGVLESAKVVCPDCGRAYVVVAAQPDARKATEIREV